LFYSFVNKIILFFLLKRLDKDIIKSIMKIERERKARQKERKIKMTRREEIENRIEELEKKIFYINLSADLFTWREREAIWNCEVEIDKLRRELRNM